jgi:glycosyltransferase involved in cell wall biosynthesis
MRVIQLINAISPTRGGPSYVVIRLARALHARGVGVEVVATSADLDAKAETEVRGLLGEVPLHLVKAAGPARLELSPRWVPLLWERLANADVAHVHTVFTWPVAVAPFLCRARRVPYVIRPAGTLDESCRQMGHSRQKELAVSLYVRRALDKAAAVQATSDLEAADLRRLAPRARVVVAEPGIEIPVAPVSISNGRRRVGSLGRIHPIKQLEVLLRAVARLGGVELWLAGAGEPAYVASLERLAASLGVAVRFLGHLDERDKAEFLSACDIFAFPSKHESFGVSAAEAMAAGRPVVVSPQVSLAGAVLESGAGRVAPAEPEAFSGALAALLEDGDSRARAGAAARALAISRWDCGQLAERMVRVYEQALGARS